MRVPFLRTLVVLSALPWSVESALGCCGCYRCTLNVPSCSSALVEVHLPADAKLFFGDSATTLTGSPRVFVTPSLIAGYDYAYTLKIEALRDGRPATETKVVNVRAFQTTRVVFTGTGSGTGSGLPEPKELPELPHEYFPHEQP
ncbi:MAG: TIGR03000 domain-containing protein [Isosphaerales bacterium]